MKTYTTRTATASEREAISQAVACCKKLNIQEPKLLKEPHRFFKYHFRTLQIRLKHFPRIAYAKARVLLCNIMIWYHR